MAALFIHLSDVIRVADVGHEECVGCDVSGDVVDDEEIRGSVYNLDVREASEVLEAPRTRVQIEQIGIHVKLLQSIETINKLSTINQLSINNQPIINQQPSRILYSPKHGTFILLQANKDNNCTKNDFKIHISTYNQSTTNQPIRHFLFNFFFKSKFDILKK
jgi:hypothetical protein